MKNLLISLFIGGLISSLINYFFTLPNGSAGAMITIVFAGVSFIYLSLLKNRKRKKKQFLQGKLDKNKTQLD